MEDLRTEIFNILKETFLDEQIPQSAPTQSAVPASIERGPKKVRFNTGTESEYEVLFSERGFLVDNTRMSFEEIENALSKQYTITLKEETVLDAVKMQQILKYKDMF